VLTAALDVLPPGEFDTASWKVWTLAVSAATGAKGKALYHPLRLALTGESHGPEMAPLLTQVGRARIKERLERAIAADAVDG